MAHYETIASALATAFLLDALHVDPMVRRGEALFGKRWRFLRPVALRVVARFPGSVRPSHRDVARFIRRDRSFLRAINRHEIEILEWPVISPRMAPAPPATLWRVPAIATVGELAEWLGISVRHLEWFADLRCWEAKRCTGKLRHYHYRVLPKRSGGVRLIEAPKSRLKEIQRRILAEILDRVPPHGAAHGFRPGRSIKSFAAPHVGRSVVLKIDLCDFFPTITATRVQSLFRTIGYPEVVANLLAGLCVNQTPDDVWTGVSLSRDDAQSVRRLYARAHLPQGAPTSPAIANLGAYRLDCRLAALARSAGADYSRYADDLAFSGGAAFARVAHRFRHHAGAVILEEGFRPNFRKTRIMRPGVRQQLAGLVVNETLNVPRDEFDRLKAVLTNCLRHGAAAQNREGRANFRAYLAGKVAFVESIHRGRGEKLRALLNQIRW
jgi:RNA-directed DNA polymerase